MKSPDDILIMPEEIQITAIRAQGPGGQNVNKVSTAVQLRFDIHSSNLSQVYKERLLKVSDQRLTQQGELIIKCQSSRSFEKNKIEALQRLKEWIFENTRVQKKRKATRPTGASKERRKKAKSQRGEIKLNRRRVDY